LVAGAVLWSAAAAPLVPDGARVTGIAATEPVLIEHVDASDIVVILHDDRVERCAISALTGGTVGEPFDPHTPMTAYATLPDTEPIGGSPEAAALRRA